MRTIRRLPLLLVAITSITGSAAASIVRTSLTVRTAYLQTSDATLLFASTYLTAQAQADSFASYDRGTVDTPGSGGVTLIAPTDPNYPVFEGYSAPYNDQASLDAAYPAGPYVFTLSNSGTGATATATVAQGANAFPTVTPRFANYDALTVAGPNASFTLHFTGGLPPAPISGSFFGIEDQTTGAGFASDTFGSADSIVIPRGFLVAGHQFHVALLFARTILAVDPATGIEADRSFISQTAGYFTTPAAVPEPASWTLLVGGFGLIGTRVRARRSRRQCDPATTG